MIMNVSSHQQYRLIDKDNLQTVGRLYTTYHNEWIPSCLELEVMTAKSVGQRYTLSHRCPWGIKRYYDGKMIEYAQIEWLNNGKWYDGKSV